MKFLIFCTSSFLLVYQSSCMQFDARKIDDKTVFLNMDEKLNWFDAQESCKRYNLSLVSILSEKENRELTDLLPGRPDVWIGGYKKGGVWRWINDEAPMEFTSWSAGEPNSLEDDNENCVHMTSWDKGHWNDVRCVDRNYYICELQNHQGNHKEKEDEVEIEVLISCASIFRGLNSYIILFLAWLLRP